MNSKCDRGNGLPQRSLRESFLAPVAEPAASGQSECEVEGFAVAFDLQVDGRLLEGDLAIFEGQLR